MTEAIGRRRFFAISAAALGVAAGVLGVAAGAPARAAGIAGGQLHRWAGTALGADAEIQLHHSDAAEARTLLQACVHEIARLEAVFSIYRADSAVARLNRDGRLDAPPLDLLHLLQESRRFSELSGGAFDVSVQPLWALHARSRAPSEQEVAAARALVDYRNIDISGSRIAFAKPGMALTFNGIAQGYITDRVAELLRARGMGQVLVDLGEIRGLGDHPSGRPWHVGLEAPPEFDGPGQEIELRDSALATSAPHGHWFDRANLRHHLLDPANGESPRHHASVTVTAPSATTADALSTALSILPAERAADCLKAAAPATAYFARRDGTRQILRTD